MTFLIYSNFPEHLYFVFVFVRQKPVNIVRGMGEARGRVMYVGVLVGSK